MWLLSDKIVSRVKARVTLDVEGLAEDESIPRSKGPWVDTHESSVDVAMSDEVRPPPLEWRLPVQQRDELPGNPCEQVTGSRCT